MNWDNEHPAVVDPSGARLTYDSLKRAPHSAIGDDDLKLQLTDVLVTIIELWGASTWIKALTEVWMRQFRIAVAFANAKARLSETFAL